MYRIIDRRGTGKTSRLLLLAKEHNGIVVCKDPEVLRIKAHSYGITGLDFVSYYEYSDFIYGYGNRNLVNKSIFIDELDLFLKHLDCNIQGYTVSNED